VDRLIPEPAAFAAATAFSNGASGDLPVAHEECGVGPPFGNPAPGKGTLDGDPKASIDRLTSLLLYELIHERRRASRNARLPCRGVINRVQGWATDL
jgi:hypothetical protein